MIVTAEKHTSPALALKACTTTLGGKESKVNMATLYMSEHSPIRTQMFWIEMFNIPSFVSVHFVRHKIGVEHFVQTLRDDRGGEGSEGRLTPVNHSMWINAHSLMHLARARLCYQAHDKTRRVMEMIVRAVRSQDPALAIFMVPKCSYLGRCIEPKPCGKYKLYDRARVDGLIGKTGEVT